MNVERPSLERSVAEILASSYFDAGWYLDKYRDVAILQMSAAEHYLRVGALIGRAPGPGFDGARYLRENADVAMAGFNPLLHYLRRGKCEGRLVHRLERAPIGNPSEHLNSLADARLAGAPQRMFAGFDFEAQEDFLACLACVAISSQPAPTVSIVMPTYNRGGLILQAIDSVRAQEHESWELLVVDDGSTDDTFEVLGAFASDRRIRLFRQDHRGVSAARNTGLAHAAGEWIFYLDSDNRWSPGFLSAMVGYLELTGRACGYSAIAVEDEAGNVKGYRGEPYDWEQCLRGNYVDLNAFCHRRSLYADLGGFDESLRRMVDWDLILRYTKKAQPAYAPLVGCRYRDSSTDQSRISVSQPIAYRSIVQAKNRLDAATPEQIAYALTLSIAIKIPVPSDKRVEWGDYHFAESLKSSLEQIGHLVTIDFLGDWYARPVNQDQVVIVLRGLTAYEPRPGQVNVLWNISHPDQVGYEEYESYDLIYVASLSYPDLLGKIITKPVRPLLQCTDTDRFHPVSQATRNSDVLFVGNSRNEYRRIVRWAVESGANVRVHGTRWKQFIDEDRIAGENIDNRQLGNHYSSAKAVLNDHWDSMRDFGFVSNRVFDVLAAGGRLVSDRVPALARLFPDGVHEIDSAEGLSAALVAMDADPSAELRQMELAASVASMHSFDARAKQVCNDVFEWLGLPRIHTGNDGTNGLGAGRRRRRVGLLMQKGQYGPTSSGYIRLLAPLTTDAAHAQLEVLVLAGVDDPALEQCDGCVVQRVAVGTKAEAESLLARLRALDTPLFVDTDDAFSLLDSNHPETAAYRSKDDVLRYLMREARQVWFSTERLQSFYREAGSRGRVIRNMLDPRLWRDYRKVPQAPAKGGALEMLYMGTATHDSDFAFVLPALDRLHDAYPGRFRVNIIGALRRPPAREWLRTTLPSARGGDYPRFVRWLARQGQPGVGLAPLCASDFNACKSDIKFLDYSALGLLSVLSKVPAYAGAAEAGLAVSVPNTAEAWFSTLESILLGQLDVNGIAERARDYVWNERSVDNGDLAATILRAIENDREVAA
jgi:hypothetical protein